jgi:hypothetical protein
MQARLYGELCAPNAVQNMLRYFSVESFESGLLSKVFWLLCYSSRAMVLLWFACTLLSNANITTEADFGRKVFFEDRNRAVGCLTLAMMLKVDDPRGSLPRTVFKALVRLLRSPGFWHITHYLQWDHTAFAIPWPGN